MLSLWSVLGNPSQIRLLLSSIKGCHLESQGSKHKLDCWWQRLGFHGILRGKLVSHLHPTSLNMRRAANCSPFRFPRADCWASVKCCVTDFSLKVLYTNSRETHAHTYTQTNTNHLANCHKPCNCTVVWLLHPANQQDAFVFLFRVSELLQRLQKVFYK